MTPTATPNARRTTPPVLTVPQLLSAAFVLNGVSEQGKDNHGQMVELMLKGVGLEAGEPWCAAYVHHIGYWAAYDPIQKRSAWPLPATGACAELGAFAAKRQALVTTPEIGDVFLMYFPEHQRFAHTGFVIGILDDGPVPVLLTIEGNTNTDGSRNGWEVAIRTTRRLDPAHGHRFIRWTALLPALSPAPVATVG